MVKFLRPLSVGKLAFYRALGTGEQGLWVSRERNWWWCTERTPITIEE